MGRHPVPVWFPPIPCQCGIQPDQDTSNRRHPYGQKECPAHWKKVNVEKDNGRINPFT